MNELIKLVKGYQKFRGRYFEGDNPLYEHLVEEGQKPKFLVIGCCDSRVDPALITGSAPGDLFVVRNVANLVPPYDNNPKHHATSAALEFAVCGLGVKHIIVLGHNHCGGIQALLKNEIHRNNDGRGFIESWMNIAAPAREIILKEHAHEPFDQQTNHCEKLALSISLDNLMTFPWIKERVEAGKLHTHAWYFDLSSGEILWLNPKNNKFEALELLLEGKE